MRIALYDSRADERGRLADQLCACAREHSRPAEVTAYGGHEDLLRTVERCPGAFDLFVVAEDGPFSLEMVEFLCRCMPPAPVIWFSDLDFAVRSYACGVAWFGKKPVCPETVRRAFARALEGRGQPPGSG